MTDYRSEKSLNYKEAFARLRRDYVTMEDIARRRVEDCSWNADQTAFKRVAKAADENMALVINCLDAVVKELERKQ